LKKIFLSAVSSEFKSVREALKSDMRSVGFDVKEQQDFRPQPDSFSLLDNLHSYVIGCDAVVALVGLSSGSFPHEKEADRYRRMLPSNLTRASYTQWEIIFAVRSNRRLLTLVAGDAFGEHGVIGTDSEQATFRAWLFKENSHFPAGNNLEGTDAFARAALKAVNELEKQIRREQRRFMAAVITSLLAVIAAIVLAALYVSREATLGVRLDSTVLNRALEEATRGGRTDEIVRLKAQGARLDEAAATRLVGASLHDIAQLRSLVGLIHVAVGQNGDTVLARVADSLADDLEHLARLGDSSDQLDDGESIIRFCARSGTESAYWLGLKDAIPNALACAEGMRSQRILMLIARRAQSTERAVAELGKPLLQQNWAKIVTAPFMNVSVERQNAQKEFRSFLTINKRQLGGSSFSELSIDPSDQHLASVAQDALKEKQSDVNLERIFIIETDIFKGSYIWMYLPRNVSFDEKVFGSVYRMLAGRGLNLLPYQTGSLSVERITERRLISEFTGCFIVNVPEKDTADGRCSFRAAVVLGASGDRAQLRVLNLKRMSN
jgi:hypothetical protein